MGAVKTCLISTRSSYGDGVTAPLRAPSRTPVHAVVRFVRIFFSLMSFQPIAPLLIVVLAVRPTAAAATTAERFPSGDVGGTRQRVGGIPGGRRMVAGGREGGIRAAEGRRGKDRRKNGVE